MKQITKHMSFAVPLKVYEEIKEVAAENEVTLTRAINSILVGYLKAREARRKRDDAND